MSSDQTQSSPANHRLTFGIFPGSATGTELGMLTGPPDDPARIQAALDDLQGACSAFVVRGYLWYEGAGVSSHHVPANVLQYAGPGRGIDLVLCYRDASSDLDAWCDFIQRTVHEAGPVLASLQITEEPNNPNPDLGGDGASPSVLPAIVAGVIAAKEAARAAGYACAIGFNFTPSFPPADFWHRLGALTTPRFLDCLDYVGLDFFPDVFRPLAADGEPGDIRSSVAALLRALRTVSLPAVNIPATVPLHICENGWPTGPGRPDHRQAQVLEHVVRTIQSVGASLNITQYEYFGLRDAASANPDLFHQFGLLRDDYAPKPAYTAYKRLISEFGVC